MFSLDDRTGNVLTTVTIFSLAAAILYSARSASHDTGTSSGCHLPKHVKGVTDAVCWNPVGYRLLTLISISSPFP